MGAVAHGDAEGDGLARVEVKDDADEVPMLFELELSDVTGPDHVRGSAQTDDRGNLRRAEDAVVLLEDALDLLAELPVANGIDAVLAFAAENMVVEGAAINL